MPATGRWDGKLRSTPLAAARAVLTGAAAVCAAFAVCVVAASPAGAAPLGAEFGDPDHPMYIAWYGSEIQVRVTPRPNEGYIQIAERVMADPGGFPVLVIYNDDRAIQVGRAVVVPLNIVKPTIRIDALRALYPGDEPGVRGWVHRVVFASENLIQLTQAFTGSKRRFQQLARYNNLKNPDLLRIGMRIEVPYEWIPDELQLRALGVKPPLTLERDETTGRHFARYQLRQNETLYSSVILRFTDRERASEVQRLAGQLVRLNGLRNAESVPTDRPLRIPIEWISEEFLADGRPHAARPPPPSRRKLAPPPRPGAPTPAPRGELAPPRRPAPKQSTASHPIHVIIDPGHGGVDAGATYGSRRKGDLIYEDEVTYDISLRLGNLLKAQGHPIYYTVRDPNQKGPLAKLATRHDRDEIVLVTPPYRIDSVKVGVNMRVYRVEALFRRLTQQRGVAPENIVLVSIHGDALAPQLRGAMVYYPDKQLRYKIFQPKGRPYRLRKEAVPSLIRFREGKNKTAAELSRAFAEDLVASLRREGIGISGRKPVRGYYYREGERTLPAVLRYSRVPTSVLLEVTNLNNPQDRRAILKSATRQRIARAIARAITALRPGRSLVAARK